MSGKRLCKDCPMWKSVTPNNEYGACQHPDRPWDTPERDERDGQWSACTLAEEECLAGLEAVDG